MKIEYSVQEARANLELINAAVKAVGLDAAQAGLVIASKLQQALQQDANQQVGGLPSRQQLRAMERAQAKEAEKAPPAPPVAPPAPAKTGKKRR